MMVMNVNGRSAGRGKERTGYSGVKNTAYMHRKHNETLFDNGGTRRNRKDRGESLSKHTAAQVDLQQNALVLMYANPKMK
jgi:hypothetical protein